MGSEADIRALERIIVQYAGPLGKFVVKKSLADLGCDTMNLTPDIRPKLVDMVLERAIYDRERWHAIRREITEAWKGGGADA